VNLSTFHARSQRFLLEVADVSGPIDLSALGLTFRAKLRTEDPDPPLIVKSTPSDITISNQGTHTGEAVLALEPGDTQALPDDRVTVLRYQLDLIDGTDVFEVQSGTLSVVPSV
jgi:hypothetical protein